MLEENRVGKKCKNREDRTTEEIFIPDLVMRDFDPARDEAARNRDGKKGLGEG